MPYAAHADIPITPSDVACVELVNSSFTDYLGTGATTDRITLSRWQAWFLERYRLKPDTREAAPIEELVALRRDLKQILGKWAARLSLGASDVSRLDSWVRASAVRQRVVSRDGGPQLVQEPLQRDWIWVMSELAASAVELMRTSDPQRLKTCGNPGCSWLFYDTSVNHSRRYCTATPCGSLMRVRRFRESR